MYTTNFALLSGRKMIEVVYINTGEHQYAVCLLYEDDGGRKDFTYTDVGNINYLIELLVDDFGLTGVSAVI